MVRDAANSDRVSAYIMDDATDIAEDLAEVFLSEGDARTLYVEHDVDVEFGVGVCHDIELYVVFYVQGLTSPGMMPHCDA